MKIMKKVSLKQFEKVADDNGYEIYTPEEIASYYKDGIMKSRNSEFDEREKEVFTTDLIYLQKAVCSDEQGNDVIRYYRKKQVDWEQAEDGTIMKGFEGVYLDTAENRRLNRVGQAFVPSKDFLKSIDGEEGDLYKSIDSDILKAMRTGRYADTPENRRLHRVGQPYKTRAKKAGGEEEKSGKDDSESKQNNFSEKVLDKNFSVDQIDDLAEKYIMSDPLPKEARKKYNDLKALDVKGLSKDESKKRAIAMLNLGNYLGVKREELEMDTSSYKEEGKQSEGEKNVYKTGESYSQWTEGEGNDGKELAKKHNVELYKFSNGDVGLIGTKDNVKALLEDMDDEEVSDEDMEAMEYKDSNKLRNILGK